MTPGDSWTEARFAQLRKQKDLNPEEAEELRTIEEYLRWKYPGSIAAQLKTVDDKDSNVVTCGVAH
jgi:hypothetical protein